VRIERRNLAEIEADFMKQTFERIESTAQYRGFSLSHFAAIGHGKKNWKSSLTIRGDISTYRRENGQS